MSGLIAGTVSGWAVVLLLVWWLIDMHGKLVKAQVDRRVALGLLEDTGKRKDELRARLNATVTNLRAKSSDDTARHLKEVALVWDKVRDTAKAYEDELHALNVTLDEAARRRIRDRSGSPLRVLLSDPLGSGGAGAVPDGAPASSGGVDTDPNKGSR